MFPRKRGPAERGRRDHIRTEHLTRDLARRSVRGGVVTMGAQSLKVVAQVATIVVLARLLSPTDFGLFAIVVAFLSILELFKDLGLSSATVQRPDITDAQVTTLFWLNAALGTAVAAALALLAPVLAALYDSPVLASVTPAVAVTLVLTGLAAQHLALLRRQMRFTALAAVQTGAEIVAMAAAIGAALAGLGLWALVVQRLTWGLAIAVGAWSASGWRPGRPARLREVRGLVVFGGNVTGAMVLGRCASSLDKILIGWFWAAPALGLFERAQKLIMMPIQNVNVPLSAVALPMLSRLADKPDRYRRAYAAVAEPVAMAVAPAAGLVFAAAAPVVDIVLGAQWGDAAPIMSWLALSAVYMPVTYTLSWLYISQDRTPELLRAAVVNTVLILGAIVLALPLGPAGIAAVIVLSGAGLRVPALLWLAGRRGPVGFRDLLALLLLPAAGALAAAVAVSALQQVPAIAALSPAAEVGVCAAAAYGAALALYGLTPRGRRAIADVLRHSRNLSSQGARP